MTMQTYAAHSYSYSIIFPMDTRIWWTKQQTATKCARIVPFTHISPIYHSYPLDAIHIQVDPGWSRLTSIFLCPAVGTQRDARATLLAFLQRRFRQVWQDVGERIWKERKEHTLPSYPPLFHREFLIEIIELRWQTFSIACQPVHSWKWLRNKPKPTHVLNTFVDHIPEMLHRSLQASHSLPSVSQGGAEHETILLQAVEEVLAPKKQAPAQNLNMPMTPSVCVFFVVNGVNVETAIPVRTFNICQGQDVSERNLDAGEFQSLLHYIASCTISHQRAMPMPTRLSKVSMIQYVMQHAPRTVLPAAPSGWSGPGRGSDWRMCREYFEFLYRDQWDQIHCNTLILLH